MDIRTSDLYEAAYYLTEGITPHQITCRTLEKDMRKELLCDFFFQSDEIGNLQGHFLRSEAAVNLALFRRCFAEVSNYANNAKRDYKKAHKGGRM